MPTWLFLPWFRKVGDAGVGAHQNIARVQHAFQKALFGLRQVDAS